ncbi:MAG: 4,5-DOPA dioxygenase extradiol [Candidatus Omnitrophica bacterium]|nr:4,5-DOPA dioxygenase extradiol [Candidatus Omnitrophota bacterium]
MPVLFVGHGSPINAIEDNAFTRRLKELGGQLPRPQAVLCISAHWETAGTQVLVNETPATIHDFYGFPKQLNEYDYPAPGAVAIAQETIRELKRVQAQATSAWGLDHGAWAILTHLYPKADVPVFQVSLDKDLSMEGHYAIGRLLAPLRAQGVLILGSGNIVHNLGAYDPDTNARPYDWAVTFDDGIKAALQAHDIGLLTDPSRVDQKAARLSLPTEEHYTPLLYVVGASHQDDKLSFPFEGIQNASMSMRMVAFS